jgi:exodeoxyribonuclease VII large subunit
MGALDQAQVLSVAELDRRLKRAVEGVSVDAWVEGEVSGANAATSGHVYFTLKDEREDAVIECVMYRSAPVRARQLVTDGARVQLFGRATVWAPRGRLQFVGERAQLTGRGALLEALENLKNKLLAEGLFAPERKKPIPRDAAVIGVVTSASGAAIHDIATVAFARGGVRIVLSPTLVQGPGAAPMLIEAINRLEKIVDLDVMIVGRGGGSAEDLMVFNDEAVVRRIAACRVPVVSAVGHETDVTITDLVADARAATPSQAAEMLVADARARAESLRQLCVRLERGAQARIAEDRAALSALRSGFARLSTTLAEHQQALDDLARRLSDAAKGDHVRRSSDLQRLERRLAGRHPRSVIASSRASLGPLAVRLRHAMRARVDSAASGLGSCSARLDAMSPLGVLGRGYAIVTTDEKRAVRDASEVSPGQRVSIRVHRGDFCARVESAGSESGVGDVEKHP